MHRSPSPQCPSQRIRRWIILICLALLIERLSHRDQPQPFVANLENSPSIQALLESQATLPPWSLVKPANHGTNPIPDGFVQTAVYEDVARLAFPTPAPVAAGLRARVLLGEMPGATGRHRYIRIEELANIKENRLVERRVMPADHLVVYAQSGKTEAEVRAGLPPGFVIRKKLYSGTGVSPVSPEPSRRYLIGFESKNADSLEQATEALKKLPILTSAVPDGYVFSSSIPNDPLFNQQWGLHNTGQTVNGVAGTADADIDAPEAWDLTTGSSAVTVAVIDSGIDLTHEDLVDNIWKNPGESGGGKETNTLDDDNNGLTNDVHGWDFVNDDNVPQDDFGHGTHVAGIIGAKGNNGLGIAGVCWNLSLVSLKVLRSNGSGLWSDVVDAIEYCKTKGFAIANLSLGAYGSVPSTVSSTLTSAEGLLLVAAAGNGAITSTGRAGDNLDEIPFMPAGFDEDNIIAVSAVKNDGLMAAFSNFGKYGADVAAPGTGILSTVMGGGYGEKSGTSMACAFVAGAAAVYLSQTENSGPLDIRHQLQMAVHRTPRLENGCLTEGRIDLRKTAISSSGRWKWRHLARRALGGLGTGSVQQTSDFSRHYAHILPEGSLAGETIEGPLRSDEGFPSDNLLSLFDNSPFALDADLRVWFRTGAASAFGMLPAEDSGPFSRIAGLTNVVYGVGTRIPEAIPGASYLSTLFLRSDGSVWSWGAWNGRHAPSDPAHSDTLAPIPSLSQIVQIEADNRGENYISLDRSGVVHVFGLNTSGFLCLGHSTPVPEPTAIPDLPPISRFQIAGGKLYLIASDETVYVGNNSSPATSLAFPSGFRYRSFQGDEQNLACIKNSGAAFVSSSGNGFSTNGNPPLPIRDKVTSIIYDPYDISSSLSIIKNCPFTITLNGRLFEWGNLLRSYSSSLSNGQVPAHLEIPSADGTVECFAGRALNVDGRCHVWGASRQVKFPQTADRPVELSSLKGYSDFWFADGALVGRADNSNMRLSWMPGTKLFYTWIFEPSGTGGILPPNFLLPAANAAGSTTDTDQVGSFAGRILIRRQGNSLSYVDIKTLRNQQAAQPPVTSQGFSSSGISGTPVRLLSLFDHQPIGGYSFVVGYTNTTTSRIWKNVTSPTGSPNTPLWIDITGTLPATLNTRPIDADLVFSGGAPMLVLLCSNGSLWATNPTYPTLTYTLLGTQTGGTRVRWPYVMKTNGTVWQAAGSPVTFTQTLGATSGTAMVTQLLCGDSSMGDALTDRYYLARRADGKIHSWGAGILGQGTVNNGLVEGISDATYIWAGRKMAMARRPNGSIWAWGEIAEYGNSPLSIAPENSLDFGVSSLVLNSGTALVDWLTTYFSNEELGSINISGDEADPDRDGLTNLVEYALGSDPKVPSDGEGEEPGLTCSFETVSSEALSADGSGEAAQGELHFTVKLKRRAKRPGIDYRVEFSDDMVNWSSSPNRLMKVLESEKTVIFRDIEPLAVTARRWARLVITKGN